jgi:uncharacterized protein (UPF0332 family)
VDYLLAARKGKPKQIFLRRAYSTLYYAMFHSLANCCSNKLIGTKGTSTSKHAWLQVYRALDHGYTRSQCENKQILKKFPDPIANFGTVFVKIQIKRHNADYDPYEKFYKSEVINGRVEVEDAIKDFEARTSKDKTAFASWVVIKARK